MGFNIFPFSVFPSPHTSLISFLFLSFFLYFFFLWGGFLSQTSTGQGAVAAVGVGWLVMVAPVCWHRHWHIADGDFRAEG